MNNKINFDNYLGKHASGYVISIAKYIDGSFKTDTQVIGNAQIVPEIVPISESFAFDIASLTKTFTSIIIYRTVEKGYLKLDDIVKNIDDRFVNLDDITILDLLSHKIELWTDGYLGSAKTKEDFYKIMFNSKIKNYYRTYVDSHYIVLSLILERIYNKEFNKILEDEILIPLGLKNTSFDVKDMKNVVSCNYETVNGKVVTDIYPGVVHDTKGRIAIELGIYPGHAGLFTAASDLMKVLLSFIDDKEFLLTKESIKKMLEHDDIDTDIYNIISELAKENKIDIPIEVDNLNNIVIELSNKYENENELYLKIPRTYNNMGTRYKNPINVRNDVPRRASDNTIVFSGYTGPLFLIDFDKKIVVIIMCNVCHNSKISREERKLLSDKLMEQIYNNVIDNE